MKKTQIKDALRNIWKQKVSFLAQMPYTYNRYFLCHDSESFPL